MYTFVEMISKCCIQKLCENIGYNLSNLNESITQFIFNKKKKTSSLDSHCGLLYVYRNICRLVAYRYRSVAHTRENNPPLGFIVR